MILKSLKLNGFKSFKDECIFNFPTKPGLYFLTGKNESEKELEGNGAGKSTLLEGLCWVLYGKTSRKLKAGDVESWGEDKKSVIVEVEFNIKDNNYHILRTRTPNTLKISKNNGKFHIIEQLELENLIKLNYEEFLFTVIFGQFRPMFFDKKASEKMELFATVLNLQEWDNFSVKSKSNVDRLNGILQNIEKNLSNLSGKCEILEEIDVNSRINTWEIEQTSRISELKVDIQQGEDLLGNIKSKVLGILTRKQQIEDDIGRFEQDLEEVKNIKDELKKEKAEILTEIRLFQHEIEDLENKLNRLENSGPVCSHCLQKIDKDHKNKHKVSFESSILKNKQKIKSLNAEIDDINEELNEANEAFNELRKDFEKMRLDNVSFATTLKSLKQKTVATTREIELNESRLQAVKSKENPHIKEREDLKNQLKKLQISIKDQNDEHLMFTNEKDAYAFWNKSFKDLRLFIVEEVLTQLELEVNDSLFHLGLKDWKVEFSVDKETKSGTVQRQFTVLIYSPYNDYLVPWESWSGGESQRLRLSGTFGLSNLICNRKGVAVNTEFYDEPSAGLNQKGIFDLLESLRARALDLNKSIFIIDHRNLESTMFDGSYVVIKDEYGSRIEEI